MSATIDILDEYLDPVTDAFSPELARRIVNLRATAAQQARMDELADKANEGRLSPAEDAEYKARIEALDIVSIIQLKAREFLSNHQQ